MAPFGYSAMNGGGDERNAVQKALAVLATLTPDTPRKDFDVHWVKFAAGVAHDAGKTYAAIVLSTLQVQMNQRNVTQAAIDHAQSVVERWISELG
jgi:hypothetical protein